MKRILSVLVFVLLGISAIGQKRTFKIVDSETKRSLEVANVCVGSDTFVKPDAKGTVTFRSKDSEQVAISYVGYYTMVMDAADLPDTVYLEKSVSGLDEVVVRQKTIQILRPKKSIGNLNPRNFGDGGAPLDENELFAVFIPNQTGHDYQLRSVAVEPTDYTIVNLESGKETAKQKNQKYAPFKLTIYSTNPEYGIPDKPLLEKELTVALSGNETFATVHFDEPLTITDSGFFIVLSAFDTDYYKNLGFRSSPAFQKVQAVKETPYLILTKNTVSEEGIWYQTNQSRDYNQVISYRLEVTF
ncbi:peptidase associated/transthyretin-like domain-containing protein [Flavobacterium silvaticum]|uniref:Carboxypeptidase-like regulatory domain-containing protein n=1 Tax=Flavobacterium silvaticum TaxID=1852020 RepID=A0A972JJ60_9FLAO|nr:hypothetical protein [Flavobacterium silvaticum]NMH27882.1 carboxypeptidase-like regulatory domain-containing protein [Flavobacterium silvaticum]